jgi:hypothetical protein
MRETLRTRAALPRTADIRDRSNYSLIEAFLRRFSAMIKDWKSFAELPGITAVVASLIFVGLQLKQAQAIASTLMMTSL